MMKHAHNGVGYRWKQKQTYQLRAKEFEHVCQELTPHVVEKEESSLLMLDVSFKPEESRKAMLS
jgi:hypothetical protein